MSGTLLLGLVILVCVAIWILAVLANLFNAVVEFLEAWIEDPIRGFFETRRKKKLENRTKQLIERSQEIIDDHLSRINAHNLGEDIYLKTQDCMAEIAAKKGGKPKWILKGPNTEYYTAYHGSMPAEWHNLKDHVSELFLEKTNTLQQEQERQQTAAQRKKFFDDNWDLISKFLEIAERKVSILDEYGEENWDALPQEIATVLFKIAKRNKLPVDEKELRTGFGLWSLGDEYRWLKERLEVGFREYHDKLKARPRRSFTFDGLSGTEFETRIARLLKERGFDVQGTPITGDQGADLIAKKNGQTIIIQAKCYQGTVGNGAVQEVIGALAYYGGDEGWVVTNASFTSSAKALAQKSRVRLVDGSMLKNGIL
jgi:Restriction endonuclease